MPHTVTLVPGDWIGPEVSEIVLSILEAAGADITWEIFSDPCDRHGDPGKDLIASARRNGVVLFNRIESRRDEGHLPPTVAIRRALGCFAQVRYAQNLPGLPARFDNVDIAVVRELTEDVYSGLEHETSPEVYELIKVTTVEACERAARFAFDQATAWGRKKVTVVHKSNIMKKSDGLWLRTAQRVSKDYPDIVCDEVIVDALCMKMVRWPAQFDVLLAGNLFGDIVADLAAGLAGGITMGGGTSYGEGVAMFENPHGKAPELVGRGVANPLPMLIPAINLLHHLEEHKTAKAISAAMKGALTAGVCTRDLGGTASSRQLRDAIIERL
jgi:isocitrate dehydrogenase (NAD+)